MMKRLCLAAVILLAVAACSSTSPHGQAAEVVMSLCDVAASFFFGSLALSPKKAELFRNSLAIWSVLIFLAIE